MAMREEFEIWAESQGYNTERYADDDHGYIFSDTCEVWDAWQASRAALRVELPEDEYEGRGHSFEEGFASGYNSCLGEIKKAPEQAGVNHK